MSGRRSLLARTAALALGTALALAALSTPAYAVSGDITALIDSVRLWVAGILAALATLFLTIGAARYLIANGNPRAMEESKDAMRSALIGYALAALSPLFVDIVRRVIGA